MKKIFVIIVTYKGKCWYDKCFASLRKSTIPVQTVVVDNSPGNEDVDYIQTNYPEIHIIKSNDNLGFGKANNLGLRYALDNECDYVFLLNQDAWLIQNDVLEQLLRISERHPECAILSPLHLTADKLQLSIQYENTKHMYSQQILNDLFCGRMKELYITDYVNAAAWFIPRYTLEIVGGFNPLFHLYGEDDDYLNRVHYHKLKVAICPSLKIIHDHVPFSNERTITTNRTFAKNLLVELLDINKPDKTKMYIKYYLRKMIISYIMKDIKQANLWKEYYKYIKENKDLISKSRELTTKSNMLWIY